MFESRLCQIDDIDLLSINGGGKPSINIDLGDLYDDAKSIYKDVREHYNDMKDFVCGFIDGISGK